MALVHGSSSLVVLDKYPISDQLNTINFNRTKAANDVTVFGDANADFFPDGLRGDTLSLSGFLGDAANVASPPSSGNTEVALDDILAKTANAPASLVLWKGRTAIVADANTPAYLLDVISTTVGRSSAAGEIVALSADLNHSEGMDRGIVLADFTERSLAFGSTTNLAAQDNGALTSNGGVGHLHVVSMDATASWTFKIQHSVDNVVYADLITFTSPVTDTVGERSTVTGTVNRYLRLQIINNNGAAGPFKVKLLVTFARR